MFYKLQYDKYLTKNNIKYYYNSYGNPIPSRYYMLLNLLTIPKASHEEYLYIRDNAIKLAKDDYSARCKLTIGSLNMIITLFNQDSVLNFILTKNNTCYIETFCGFSTVILNLLKELSKELNIYSIHTFSIYQPETDFLLQNGFNKNKNKELEYVLQ